MVALPTIVVLVAWAFGSMLAVLTRACWLNPFYDSMLVKVTVRGKTLAETASRMERCLQEFRIRGVKTNIPFLIQVIGYDPFLGGQIDHMHDRHHSEPICIRPVRDRATRSLRYMADVIVNGNALVKGHPVATRRVPAQAPIEKHTQPLPAGTRDRLKELGPTQFAHWVREQKTLLLTDTTMRDVHQSLLATCVRTFDMMQIAETYARRAPEFFSLEMWGGATFDTSMRFLKESPWQRLIKLREKIPNILFQMLLRASNAVGYTNYPDNVVKIFVREAADAGIDVFRVFDALNWVDNMQVAMEAVVESGAILAGIHLLHRRHSQSQTPQVRPEILCGIGQASGEARCAHVGHQRYAGLCKPNCRLRRPR